MQLLYWSQNIRYTVTLTGSIRLQNTHILYLSIKKLDFYSWWHVFTVWYYERNWILHLSQSLSAFALSPNAGLLKLSNTVPFLSLYVRGSHSIQTYSIDSRIDLLCVLRTEWEQKWLIQRIQPTNTRLFFFFLKWLKHSKMYSVRSLPI